jgi:polysaccharide export outer membrane protein
VIEINVANHPDLTKQHIIRLDGKITVPELGEIKAEGKTPRQLAAEVENGYAATLNNAEVTVDVREAHRSVAISSSNNGLRTTVGKFPLTASMRLMDLVTVAGGLSTKPDRYSGKLIRHSSEIIELDIVRASKDPLSTANIQLEANDLVLLEAKNPRHEDVSVFGAVGHTGQFPLDDQTTLVSLIGEAGGVSEGAALTKAYVLRKGVQIPIDLRPALKLGKSDPAVNDFKLEIGDELFIPEIEARYAVMGQVGHPSYYFIPERGPVSVLEALNLAGGTLPTADAGKAIILHQVNGKVVGQTPINLNIVQKKPLQSYNITMQPDDTLYIPQRGPRGLIWQDVFTPLSALNFLGFRLFN